MTTTTGEVSPRLQWLAERTHGSSAQYLRRTCSGATRTKRSRGMFPCAGYPDHARRCRGGRVYWVVGRVELGLFFLVLGVGRTPTRALRAANRGCFRGAR